MKRRRKAEAQCRHFDLSLSNSAEVKKFQQALPLPSWLQTLNDNTCTWKHFQISCSKATATCCICSNLFLTWGCRLILIKCDKWLLLGKTSSWCQQFVVLNYASKSFYKSRLNLAAAVSACSKASLICTPPNTIFYFMKYKGRLLTLTTAGYMCWCSELNSLPMKAEDSSWPLKFVLYVIVKQWKWYWTT